MNTDTKANASDGPCPAPGPPPPPPLFIVGVPRSGTTLVATTMSRHPLLSITPESMFLLHFGRDSDRSMPDLVSAFLRGTGGQRFTSGRDATDSQVATSRDAILSQVAALSPQLPTHRRFFEALMRTEAARVGKPGFGDKTPNHWRHVGTLLDWFPGARIVWLLRDPRAVAASLNRVPWASDHVAVHARLWVGAYKELQRWRHDPRVLTVPYERFVQTPGVTANRICAHLGVPPSRALVDPCSEATYEQRPLSEWAKGHLDGAARAVSTTSLERWRDDLSPTEIATVEVLTGRRLRDAGYMPFRPALSPIPALRPAIAHLARATRSRLRRRLRKP